MTKNQFYAFSGILTTVALVVLLVLTREPKTSPNTVLENNTVIESLDLGDQETQMKDMRDALNRAARSYPNLCNFKVEHLDLLPYGKSEFDEIVLSSKLISSCFKCVPFSDRGEACKQAAEILGVAPSAIAATALSLEAIPAAELKRRSERIAAQKKRNPLYKKEVTRIVKETQAKSKVECQRDRARMTERLQEIQTRSASIPIRQAAGDAIYCVSCIDTATISCQLALQTFEDYEDHPDGINFGVR